MYGITDYTITSLDDDISSKCKYVVGPGIDCHISW